MKRIFDEKQFSGIELFCLAAELGSFTQAANTAGITPAAVSRSISRLEERLSVRLFVRTTRQIRVTEHGRRYYQQCRNALTQLEEAEREVTGEQSTPTGLLRISAPTPYGHFRLLPLLAQFRQLYPGITFEINIGNRNIDLIAEDFDLAIRMRDPKDSSMIARKLEYAELVLVASPAYLDQAGTPTHLDDLEQHDCIQFELPSTGRRIPWLFSIDGNITEIETTGSYTCTDDALGIATLAKNSAGLVQTYRFIVAKELERGELIELLPQHGGASRPVFLLYPHARHISLRLRSFIDFLIAKLTLQS
ncbi:LysR family transcriptional regulator [Neptunicella sp. SCSIO 80796]|uniref:LysR family transcriptional regulator n=1 Tax=Neptunicella plasticusilytica TaxID=3117012 RepID=UPI003A4DFA25